MVQSHGYTWKWCISSQSLTRGRRWGGLVSVQTEGQSFPSLGGWRGGWWSSSRSHPRPPQMYGQEHWQFSSPSPFRRLDSIWDQIHCPYFRAVLKVHIPGSNCALWEWSQILWWERNQNDDGHLSEKQEGDWHRISRVGAMIQIHNVLQCIVYYTCMYRYKFQ